MIKAILRYYDIWTGRIRKEEELEFENIEKMKEYTEKNGCVCHYSYEVLDNEEGGEE